MVDVPAAQLEDEVAAYEAAPLEDEAWVERQLGRIADRYRPRGGVRAAGRAGGRAREIQLLFGEL